ncbi:hypothetical protein KY326_02845 [Candidatus Woesearchaeota archaeon]|nr:hypothetical protein [Candidatus Woesearchaeota archaeon]
MVINMGFSGLVKKTKEFMVPRRLIWLLGFGALAAAFVTTNAACSQKDDDETITPVEWKTPGKTFSNYDQRKWLSANNTYIAAEKINGTAIDLQYSPTATAVPVTVASDSLENRFVAFTGDENYIVFEKRDAGDTYRTLFVWDIAAGAAFQATPSSGRFEFKDFDDLATEFCYRDIDTGQKFIHTLGTTFTQNTEFTGSEIEEYAYDKNSNGEFLIILSRDMGGGKHDLLLKDPQDNSEVNVTNTPTIDEKFIFEFRKLTGNGEPVDQGTWLVLQEVTSGNYRVIEINPRDLEIMHVYADGTQDCSIPNDPEGVPLVSESEQFVVISQDFGATDKQIFLYDRSDHSLTKVSDGVGAIFEANLVADSGNVIMRKYYNGNVWNIVRYWRHGGYVSLVTNDVDKNNYGVAMSPEDGGEFFAFVREDEFGGFNKELVAARTQNVHDRQTVSTKYISGPTQGVPFGARFIHVVANGKKILVFSEEVTPGGDVEVKAYDHETKATPANVTNDSNMKDHAFQRSGDKRRIIIKSEGTSSEKMKVYDGVSTTDYQ